MLQLRISDENANTMCFENAPSPSNQSLGSAANSVCHLVIDLKLSDCSSFASKIFISQNGGIPSEDFREIQMGNITKYNPFRDDFGPTNALSIMRFVQDFEDQINLESPKSIVYCAGKRRQDLTNAVFLLGACMILKLKHDPLDVWLIFSGLDEDLFEPYRESSTNSCNIELSLLDCWQGLKRGIDMGWFGVPSKSCPGWDQWGKIVKDEYAYFDNPLHGDLHEVVPGKMIAFKGPQDLGGPKFRSNKAHGMRDFSPEYYVDTFRILGVSTVIRLNDSEYDPSAFVAHGIKHVDLPFKDGASPPAAVMAEFFRAVDGADGLVAVHCQTGLGQTGALIALYLMRTHGFSAGEAVGWLRMMRPGSVAGAQHQFLRTIEAAVRSLVPPAAGGAASPTASVCRTASESSQASTQASEFRSCLRPVKVRAAHADAAGDSSPSAVRRRASVSWAGEVSDAAPGSPMSPVKLRQSPGGGGNSSPGAARRAAAPAGSASQRRRSSTSTPPGFMLLAPSRSRGSGSGMS